MCMRDFTTILTLISIGNIVRRRPNFCMPALAENTAVTSTLLMEIIVSIINIFNVIAAKKFIMLQYFVSYPLINYVCNIILNYIILHNIIQYYIILYCIM